MAWPKALTIKALKTQNPYYSEANNELAWALYAGGDAFNALKPNLLDPRTQDQNMAYRRARLAVARYENHIAGMFDYSRAIAFQAKPRLVFSGPDEKLEYYNTLNDGLQDTLEGRFTDMQLYGYALLTASYPASPLPAAASNLGEQLVRGGPLDAKICYLCPSYVTDWKCDELGNLEWLKVYTCEGARSRKYGEIDGKLHTWTYITRTEKAVYQKLQKNKDGELKDIDIASIIGEPKPSPLGMPVFEAALVNRSSIMERTRESAVGVYNAEANWKFAVGAQCFAQAWYAGPLSPEEFTPRMGEGVTKFLGVGGQYGFAVPAGVAFDAVESLVCGELEHLESQINSEFKNTAGKDQHAASGVVKQEEKQPAAVAAESYARKIVNATLEAARYIIASRRDTGVVDVHFEGMNNFSPLAIQDKIAAVAAYKMIPGAAPTALKIAQRDLDHAMTPGATSEESSIIDLENEITEQTPIPENGVSSDTTSSAASSDAATSDPATSTATTSSTGSSATSTGTGKSSTGILPGTEEKPGDVRVTPKLQKINPQDLISQHGVDVQFKAKLVESMKDTGFDAAHPILVADTGLGYVILDGHHRGNAAIKAGLKSIPAYVISNEDYIGLLHSKFAGVRPNKMAQLDPYIYVNGKPYTTIRDDNEHDNKSKAIIAQTGATTSAASSARNAA